MALLMAVGVGVGVGAAVASPVPMCGFSRSSINNVIHCPSRLSFSRTETLLGSAAEVTLSAQFTASLSLSTTFSFGKNTIYCGRGDRKTAKGKRFNHSFGNARPRNKKMGKGPPRLHAPPAPPRKDKFDDGEIVKIEIDPSLFS